MFIKVKYENLIMFILTDKYSKPSKQIVEIGKKNKLSGKFIFDLSLVNGLISNRFIIAEFQEGLLKTSSIKYIELDDYQVNYINKKLRDSIDDLTQYLTDTEINQIRRTYMSAS